MIDDILDTILVFLAILAVTAGLVLIGLMLAGVWDTGPLAGWWTYRG